MQFIHQFPNGRRYSHCTSKEASGNHWAVESEIFCKARGDHLEITEAKIACVFKKLSEATARWYDAGERVERNVKSTRTTNSIALCAVNTPVNGMKVFKKTKLIGLF
jgi:hypothetical protein